MRKFNLFQSKGLFADIYDISAHYHTDFFFLFNRFPEDKISGLSNLKVYQADDDFSIA